VGTFKLGLVVTCQVNGSSPFNVPDMFPPVSRGPRPQCVWGKHRVRDSAPRKPGIRLDRCSTIVLQFPALSMQITCSCQEYISCSHWTVVIFQITLSSSPNRRTQSAARLARCSPVCRSFTLNRIALSNWLGLRGRDSIPSELQNTAVNLSSSKPDGYNSEIACQDL